MLTPPSYTEIRSCLSKVQYDDKRKAKLTARRWGQRLYRCKFCRHWHLTTKVSKK